MALGLILVAGAFITSVHLPHIFEILRMLLQELLGQFPLHPTRKLSLATDQILKRNYLVPKAAVL